MLLSIFIALPKTPGTLDCSNHRTISLMSHILKLLLKIIFRKVRRQLLPEIPVNQYGFMKDRGTRNAIFVIRMVSERSIQHQQNIYTVFIDYWKAFDKVRHGELFKMLEKVNIDDKDMRILRNLYEQQRAAVRLPEGLTDEFKIHRGVRQGCVGSPNLFNLYSETILRPLEDEPDGIVVNGVKINNVRYADDTILLADSEEGLQRLFNKLAFESERYGLSINAKKTKTMTISKTEPAPKCSLKHGSTNIEQVSQFNYLGSLVTFDGRTKKEIRRRISIARSAFDQLRPILTDRKLSIAIRIRVLKCYVLSTMLYGCESWTFTAELKRNVEAAEMWYYRRMLRVSYKDHMSNEEVLKWLHQKRQLIQTIENRQIRFLGHCIRKQQLEDLALSGKIKGKRSVGGQRKTLLDNFAKTKARTIWDMARRRDKLPSWSSGFA